jgi:exopolysaccharide biosynthesis polyprenyl glycosylphosphotransferase
MEQLADARCGLAGPCEFGYRDTETMMRRRNPAVLLTVLDIIAAFLTFNAVAYLRGFPVGQRLMTQPLIAPIAILIFAIYLVEGYRARTDMLSVDYASQHTIAVFGAMVATLLLAYVFLKPPYELQSSRLVIALSFLLLIPVTLGYRRVFYLRAQAGREDRSIVFLGDPASAELFRSECQKLGTTQRVIYTVVSADSLPPFPAAEAEPLRTFVEVLREVQAGHTRVEAFVLRETGRELPPEISRPLVELYFAGVPTYTLEMFHQVYWQKIPLYRLNQTWLFQEGFKIAREPVFERIKRASDIVLSLFGLVLAAPLMAAGALAIWLEDRGPVFFVQTRIGKNHVPFRLVKLRTMRPADPKDELYTQPGDARITRIGRFLRATRLDEFPQLWNVLRGEMSLIGPRAEWDRLVLLYENEISCYHFRHLVRPGITGWAQVNYPYGASMEDTLRKLEYDLYYIRHFSFVLDASIVLKTIHIMFFGKGR